MNLWAYHLDAATELYLQTSFNFLFLFFFFFLVCDLVLCILGWPQTGCVVEADFELLTLLLLSLEF